MRIASQTSFSTAGTTISKTPVGRKTLQVGRVSKAQKRALEAGPGFFTGEEALREVAKSDGLWNWALVGSDPEKLPLSGGGNKSVEEMRDAFGVHAHCFGLLRMTFGVGDEAAMKFLFIHASDDIDSGNFSTVERGRALAMEPKMDHAIRKFAAFSAKIRIYSPEECTVQALVEKLKSVVRGIDSKRLTVENFYAAVEHAKQQHREKNPEPPDADIRRQTMKQHLDTVKSPSSVVSQPTMDATPSQALKQAVRQRKRVKLYAVGDVVEFFGMSQQKWFDDAEIASVVTESFMQNNLRVAAGSMKVVYNDGSQFRWVAPHEMEDFIRISPRPRPPDAMVGELLKESHFLFFTSWTKHYVELSKGFMQWWRTRDEATRGDVPAGTVYLMGLQQQQFGMMFKIRAEDTGGAVYAFQADSNDLATVWVEALWAHTAYCDDDHEYLATKMSNLHVRRELLNTMMEKRLQREIVESEEWALNKRQNSQDSPFHQGLSSHGLGSQGMVVVGGA